MCSERVSSEGLLTCLNQSFWDTSGDVPAPTYLINPDCVSPALRGNLGHWLYQKRGHKAKGSPSGQTVTQGADVSVRRLSGYRGQKWVGDAVGKK